MQGDSARVSLAKDVPPCAPFFSFALTMRVWLVLLLTFAVLPSLDLWVSALFYVPAKGGFFLDHSAFLQAMRQGIWSGFNVIVVLILIMGLHSLISSRPLLVPGRIDRKSVV